MERVCPLCNSLQKIEIRCPNCNVYLTDGGVITDYFGPYSPYIESSQQNEFCVHLLYCANCNYDIRKAYNFITV